MFPRVTIESIVRGIAAKCAGNSTILNGMPAPDPPVRIELDKVTLKFYYSYRLSN